MTPEEADFRARVFVNGMRNAAVPEWHEMHGRKVIATGEWSPHFQRHPWVQDAETEGWGRDLRQHCIRIVRGRIMAGQPHHEIEQIMPDAKTVAVWRTNAKRFALADEWRAGIIKTHGDVDNYLSRGKRTTFKRIADVSRKAFAAFQAASRNPVHRESILTPTSRRMTGERE